MTLIGFLIGLAVTVVVAWLIIKKHHPQTVLILAGLLLLFISLPLSEEPLMDSEKTTGNMVLDVVDFLRDTFASTSASLGLIIMAVGGFSLIMEKVGASAMLVHLAMKPLSRIRRPYIFLGIAYIFGQCLGMIIPSASGLAMLLMVTLYPLLRSLRISCLSAAALIATTSCLDLGPASSNSNLSAEVSSMTVQKYFIDYQGPVAIVTMAVIAISHMLIQRHFDKKAGTLPEMNPPSNLEQEASGASPDTGSVKTELKTPVYYAVLPLIPLVLLIVFSEYLISSVKMNVATSMLTSMLVVLIIEMIRYRSFSRASEIMKVFFQGMGKQFVAIATLIVAGQMFAAGLTQIGFIKFIVDGAFNLHLGVVVMTVLMTLIILLTALLTGSGNAAWFAFAPLAPQVAQPLGQPAVAIALPMELSAGIGRSMSPISGVLIAVSGLAEVNPVDLAKRTIPVMAAAYITQITTSFIWLYLIH